VPPGVYGGTELVIDQLARGLVREGCEVALFTTGNATCPVARHWHYSSALGMEADLSAELAHVEHAYRALEGTDLIHDHTTTGPACPELVSRSAPVVTTVHGPFTRSIRGLYARAADRVAVVAVSHAQRRSAPEVPVTAVIHHGIDIRAHPFGRGEGGYVLFLGRMSPDKGVHRAIAVARAAGRRIVVAAKMREAAERRYFIERVEPLLGPDAIYVGEVGFQQKLELLGGAEALLNPIRWPEPFGLVMVEALACGTPVLSFGEGAATEIVEHGRTGFLCTDEGDMVARLGLVRDLDRATCRARAGARFSTERMVRDHLALYRRLLRQPVLDPASARTRRTSASLTDRPARPSVAPARDVATPGDRKATSGTTGRRT
jgi:glycosyltransferase involved in cell wall biosynthesis